ncbi:MAG: glycosyltransferase family 87 protein [Candidatus Limnocylindrales bacterium]
MSKSVRAARLVAVGILIGWSATQIYFRISAWSLSDMDAYWNAALRLRSGEPLFPALVDTSAPDVYRYSPWFAAAWVPFTHLPKAFMAIAWSAILLVASYWCVRPLLRRDLASIAAVVFFGSFLIWGTSIGNVQPLMIAALMHGMERRSGPLWIGVAASLKAVPILFLLVYLGRGEWRRAGAGLLVAASLSAATLLVDLTHYPSGPGDAPSPLFLVSPLLLGAAVTVVAGITLMQARRRSPFDRLAAAGAALTALPRITLLDLPMLLVGLRPTQTNRSKARQ